MTIHERYSETLAASISWEQRRSLHAFLGSRNIDSIEGNRALTNGGNTHYVNIKPADRKRARAALKAWRCETCDQTGLFACD
jgi:hypothetical protein